MSAFEFWTRLQNNPIDRKKIRKTFCLADIWIHFYVFEFVFCMQTVKFSLSLKGKEQLWDKPAFLDQKLYKVTNSQKCRGQRNRTKPLDVTGLWKKTQKKEKKKKVLQAFMYMTNFSVPACNLQDKQEKITDLNVPKKGFHHGCGILKDARNMSVFQIIQAALKLDRKCTLMCLECCMIELCIWGGGNVQKRLLYQSWWTILVKFRGCSLVGWLAGCVCPCSEGWMSLNLSDWESCWPSELELVWKRPWLPLISWRDKSFDGVVVFGSPYINVLCQGNCDTRVGFFLPFRKTIVRFSYSITFPHCNSSLLPQQLSTSNTSCYIYVPQHNQPLLLSSKTLSLY